MHQPSLLDPQAPAPAPILDPAELPLLGLTAGAMVAALDRHLDALAAIPVADWAPWWAGALGYVRLRRNPALSDPPGWWPWGYTLAGWRRVAWGEAVRAGVRDRAGWEALWPEYQVEALDARATALRVDLHGEWFRLKLAHTGKPRRRKAMKRGATA